MAADRALVDSFTTVPLLLVCDMLAVARCGCCEYTAVESRMCVVRLARVREYRERPCTDTRVEDRCEASVARSRRPQRNCAYIRGRRPRCEEFCRGVDEHDQNLHTHTRTTHSQSRFFAETNSDQWDTAAQNVDDHCAAWRPDHSGWQISARRRRPRPPL